MARYGIATGNALGVTVGQLRTVAREIGRDHALADRLWDSGLHEARILASLVGDPALVDDAQFERWAAGFDSWDLCDQVCQNLFRRSPSAWGKAVEWTARPESFVKRAGFVLMAGLAVSEKRADDALFEALLDPLAAGAEDDRPLVRKGASWALRAIGKRSTRLNRRAIETAERLQADGRARWVGTDALRELRSLAVQARLGGRTSHPPTAS
jgi:3-methyladenine DNA glycosylase AlkD